MKNLKLQIVNERRALQAHATVDSDSKEESDLKLAENGLFQNYLSPPNSQTSQKTICIKCGLNSE